MYELLIKLEKELEYKKYTIEDLREIKKILEELNKPTERVTLKRIKER